MCYLEVHEVHELGDFGLQDLNGLLVDLHPVRLFITLDLPGGNVISHKAEAEKATKWWTKIGSIYS